MEIKQLSTSVSLKIWRGSELGGGSCEVSEGMTVDITSEEAEKYRDIYDLLCKELTLITIKNVKYLMKESEQ